VGPETERIVIDGINLVAMLEVVSRYGTLGILIVVWWTDRRQIREQYEVHKKEMTGVLERYKIDMVDQRKMYDSNVRLVDSYASVSRDLKEVVIMNTQAMTQLCVDINTNQFCPRVRLDKQAKGVVNE
jgi:hypothetical protein